MNPPPPTGPPPGMPSKNGHNNSNQHHQLVLPIVSLSTTEEEDDASTVTSKQSVDDHHRALVDQVLLSNTISSSSSSASSSSQDDPYQQTQQDKSDAMAYLLRYETMVRQQEAEDMAVLAHMRPCVARLQELMNQQPSFDQSLQHHEDMEFLTHEISFVQLQKALRRLEELQKKKNRPMMEHLTTDRQLMMVLRLLTQKVDENQDECDNNNNTPVPTITWAEIVQCYKCCIAGMLTLQHLPNDSNIRARARDRTLAMLSLFEPPSTRLFHEDASSKKQNSKRTTKAIDAATRGALRSSKVAKEQFNQTKAATGGGGGVAWSIKRKTRRMLAVTTFVVICCGMFHYYDSHNNGSTLFPSRSPTTKQQHHTMLHVASPEPSPSASSVSISSSPHHHRVKTAPPHAVVKREAMMMKQQQQQAWHAIVDPYTSSAQGVSKIISVVLEKFCS